jgi:D-threo-aldose 1-dehydrogenase
VIEHVKLIPDPRHWMRVLPCGKTISALGFGCSSLWAKPDFEDNRAAEILDVLFAEGVNHFDAGPSYGAGLGERRLGRWLAGKPLEQLIVTTKIGTNLIDGRIERSFDPDQLRRSFEGSLERLGLDRVDILYLHGPAVSDINTAVLDLLGRFKADGKVGLTGVNSFDNAVLFKTAQSPVDAAMLQFNFADFRNCEAMAALHRAGKLVFSGTALARAQFALSGFIPTSRARLWYLLRMLRHDPLFALKGRARLAQLRDTGKPLAEAALQFLTGHPMIVSSLFGTSSINHARVNARAGHGHLTNQQWTTLADYA